MTVTGPSFIALQVRDVAASAAFYEQRIGLRRSPGPPNAVVFATEPIALAVREPRPGAGVALWLHADDAQSLHDDLAGAGVPVLAAPSDGPFGRQFTFADPDGYAVTVHDHP